MTYKNKLKKCILCIKRNVERKKPFCPHCYKHASFIDKIKAWKDSELFPNYGSNSKRMGRPREKFYSKILSKFNKETQLI